MANGIKEIKIGLCQYKYHDGTYCGRPIDPIHSDANNHCIFHSVLESKKVAFDRYIDDIIKKANQQSKKTNKILIDFEGFYFPGTYIYHGEFFCDVSFRNAVFSDTVDFEECIFHGVSDFKNSVFKNGANLSKAIFKKNCYFERTNWFMKYRRNYISNIKRVIDKFPIYNLKKCWEAWKQYDGLVTFYFVRFEGESVSFSNSFIQGTLNFRNVISNTIVSLDNAVIKRDILLKGSNFNNQASCLNTSFKERLIPIPKSFSAKYYFSPKMVDIKSSVVFKAFKGRGLFKESWIVIVFPILGMLLLASRFKKYEIYVSDISTNLAVYHAIRFVFIGVIILIVLSIMFIYIMIIFNSLINFIKFQIYRMRIFNSNIAFLFMVSLVLWILNDYFKNIDPNIKTIINIYCILLILVYLMIKYKWKINMVYPIVLLGIGFILFLFAPWYVNIEIRETPVLISFADHIDNYYYANLIYTSEEEVLFIIKENDNKYNVPSLYKNLENKIFEILKDSVLYNNNWSQEIKVIKIPRRELSKLIILKNSLSEIEKRNN